MIEDKKNHQIVCEYLVEKYIDRISGNEKNFFVGESPQDSILVGMLKPQNNINISTDLKNNSKIYEAIHSIAIIFYLKESLNSKIKIQLTGNYYYRVKPTYKEQIEYLLNKYSIEYAQEFNSIEELLKYNENNKLYIKDKVIEKYRRISLEDVIEPIEIDLNEFDNVNINKSINLKLKEYLANNTEDSIAIKELNTTLDELSNCEIFENTIESFSNKNALGYSLKLDLSRCELSNGLNEYKIVLINDTDMLSYNNNSYDTTLYNAGIKIYGQECKFENIDLNCMVKDYYETEIKALVENASYNYDSKNNIISTLNIPITKEKRVKTVDKYNRYITFDELYKEPIKNLKIILDELKKDYDEKNKKTYLISDANRERYQEELRIYQMEINNFENGIGLIENTQIIQNAFKYMNLTFQKNSKYPGWRLFQIVFVVSEISSIVYSEYVGLPLFKDNNIDNVDLLYFPTGGGKTEAFLGCVIFNLFFDRLRGKNGGTTAIIKYPLRLLSVQQLERVLKILVKANEILKSLSSDYEEFNVGYFVGDQNTSNSISVEKYEEMQKIDKQTFQEKYKLIDVCPKCGANNVEAIFSEKEWRLRHKCEECGFDIPILTTDEEIYRYLPSVIVSTIDKLANIGVAPKYKNLFGEYRSKCEVHGFSNKNVCMCKKNQIIRCENGKNNFTKIKDPIPTLFIQDELHLVNESLGTFASHYEGFLQYYTENLVKEENRKKIKYIGATATISKYESQINNLYYKSARKFPCDVKGENFYSYRDENDVNRCILGFATHGRSVTDGVQYACTLLRNLIQEIINNYEIHSQELFKRGFEGNKDILEKVLNDYWISIVYNTSKNDSNELANSFDQKGNIFLRSKGVDLYNIGKITGNDSFKEIKNILYEVENNENKKDTKNLILATSSISHGVDEDCFNQIFFFGMPKNTAEYIQAYSRVGRKYTGIVLDIIRLAREKDRSYLKNFNVYHDYKNRLIEQVPINRWAKNAVYNTLPGLLKAVIIQYYMPEGWLVKDFKKIMNNIPMEELIEHMLKIYKCSEMEPKSKMYEDVIREEVKKFYFTMLSETNEGLDVGSVIEKASKGNRRPMESLRDVDTVLELSIKQ